VNIALAIARGSTAIFSVWAVGMETQLAAQLSTGPKSNGNPIMSDTEKKEPMQIMGRTVGIHAWSIAKQINAVIVNPQNKEPLSQMQILALSIQVGMDEAKKSATPEHHLRTIQKHLDEAQDIVAGLIRNSRE
jgi:hypothetical protein